MFTWDKFAAAGVHVFPPLVSLRVAWVVTLACTLCGSSLAVAAEDGKSADEIVACLQRTRPLTNTVRTIELVSRDRVGAERVLRAKVYGGISREGFRTLLIQVIHPAELEGLTVLITEREGANHLFMSPAGLPDVRRIRGARGRSSLFRTDFSMADVERLYGLAQPRETHKLTGSETTASGRAAWLLETTPAEDGGSGYRRILSRVDQETCVLLQAEMYESGETPRKVLTADPQTVSREGSTWVAHDLLLRDLRDGSETRMKVDQIALGVEHEGIPFTPKELEQWKRSRSAAE